MREKLKTTYGDIDGDIAFMEAMVRQVRESKDGTIAREAAMREVRESLRGTLALSGPSYKPGTADDPKVNRFALPTDQESVRLGELSREFMGVRPAGGVAVANDDPSDFRAKIARLEAGLASIRDGTHPNSDGQLRMMRGLFPDTMFASPQENED